ncbi:MAG TPA: hypothetical protein VK203_06190 [Nostocaceae cyanobacterium]|nr:hypothetical protein [Nostocaceae cyanobacterium]
MAKESFQQLLQRIAAAHLDRKTQQYIKSLENVAQTAKLVIESSNFGNTESQQSELQPLKLALQQLELEGANAS